MKNSALTDGDIVSRVVDGDKQLYEVLVERYSQKLTRYVARVVSRPDEVDDIVQETFIKAYKNLRRFKTNMSFSSWIYRIAHNEAVNMIKSAWIQKIVPIDALFDIGVLSNMEKKLDVRDMKNKLGRCLDKLPQKYRDPLILYVYEEKTYSEISDILRIPVSTVGVLVHRAKLKVKKICRHEKA